MTTECLNDTTMMTLSLRLAAYSGHRHPSTPHCIPADSRPHRPTHLLTYYAPLPPRTRLVALQIWIRRTQLDVMRTVCYQPGPLLMPDLGEFSMEATAAA